MQKQGRYTAKEATGTLDDVTNKLNAVKTKLDGGGQLTRAEAEEIGSEISRLLVHLSIVVSWE